MHSIITVVTLACWVALGEAGVFPSETRSHVHPILPSSSASICNTSVPGYAPGPDGKSCYKLHLTGKSWAESLLDCVAEGAHLVIPNSRQEASHLIQMMAISPQVTEDGIHIGVHDLYQEGKFFTIDGYPLASAGNALWGEDQPDDFETEDCGSMRPDGMLNDIDCVDLEMPYICERELPALHFTPLEVGQDDSSTTEKPEDETTVGDRPEEED